MCTNVYKIYPHTPRPIHTDICLHIHIYTYMNIHMYIYIYIPHPWPLSPTPRWAEDVPAGLPSSSWPLRTADDFALAQVWSRCSNSAARAQNYRSQGSGSGLRASCQSSLGLSVGPPKYPKQWPVHLSFQDKLFKWAVQEWRLAVL